MMKINTPPIFFQPSRRKMLQASGFALVNLMLPEALHAAEPKANSKLTEDKFYIGFHEGFSKIMEDSKLSEQDKVNKFVNLANTVAKQIKVVFANNHDKQVTAYGTVLAYAEKLAPEGFVKQGYYVNDFLLENYLLNQGMTLEKLSKDKVFKFQLETFEIFSKVTKKPSVKANQLRSLTEIVKGTALQNKLAELTFDVYTVDRVEAPFSATIDEKSSSVIINSKYIKGSEDFTTEEDMQMSIANEALHLFLRSVYSTEFSRQKIEPSDYFSVRVGNQNIQFRSLHNAEEFLSDAASIIENPYYMSGLLGVKEEGFTGPYEQSYRIARALINKLKQEDKQYNYIDFQYKGPFPLGGMPKITEVAKNKIRSEYANIAREVLKNIIQIKEAKPKN